MLGLVGGAIAVLFGGVGWRQIKKHGAEREKRRQAERDRDAAIDQAQQMSRPPLSGPEQLDTLRRLRDDR